MTQTSAGYELQSLAASQALSKAFDAARDDFNRFAELVLLDDHGQRLQQAAIHRVWGLHVEACWQAGVHPAILAPFAHGKSGQLIVGRAAYEIGRNPNIRVKVVCNTDSKAQERVMGVRKILSENPTYRLLFPHIRLVDPLTNRREKATQHELFVARSSGSIDPTIQAAGVLSSGTGGRCDLLLLDDVVDRKNAVDEPSQRAKVSRNIPEVWMSRMEPDARLIYVGTAWHRADYTHEIMDNPAWCVLVQAISDDFSRIDQYVHNPFPGYPIPRLDNGKHS